jgi:hypothetical protein
MNRRDFLFFRTEQQRRVVELSCERLYMRYLDAQSTLGPREDADSCRDEPWGGEPPAVFDLRTTEQLFAELQHDLNAADILRVAELNWLACEPLRRHVETLIASFRARGGRVQLIR